jgi:hypothetical protein
MYYLTVDKDGKELVRRMGFEDYSEALRYLTNFYTPRNNDIRVVLSFTTEVINGEFARSYVELSDPNAIEPSDETRYVRAVKFSNAFKYEGSYFFLIESELGVQDADCEDEDDDE